MRTVDWDEEHSCVRMIDQRILPGEFEIISFTTHQELADAIRDMVVRGAPAIGAAAGYGLALAAFESNAVQREELLLDLNRAAYVLHGARPTASNLNWALKRVLAIAENTQGTADELRERVFFEAQRIADEDIAINEKMARVGAVLIDDGDTVIHHCNTGALAAVDWGTALGVIRMAHELGKQLHVLVDETRPRLQGARLTAWELDRYGISYEIISDGSAGYFLSTGQAQKVLFGADRVVANGDVANKIGTYMLSLAAQDNDIPAYCVVPTSTIDLSLGKGSLIPIEERAPEEVLGLEFQGQRVSPPGARARNPAFDVTPNHLVTAFITENGIIYPPYETNLRDIVRQSGNQ
ncbi:MAG: S-methyl-5-thioribose-1-phosphate isomerase [Anaerolineales bacterium]